MDYWTIINVLAIVGLTLPAVAFAARVQVENRRLKATLLFQGAPEAPCQKCKPMCNGLCLCMCHQKRVAWYQDRVREQCA